MHNLILFEPVGVSSLGPPVDHRPVWELRVGALSLRERLECCPEFGVPAFWSRPALRSLVPTPADSIFENSSVTLLAGNRLLSEPEQRQRLATLKPGESIEDAAGTAAICLSGLDALTWLRDHDSRLDSEEAKPGEAALRGDLGPAPRFWWELFELAAETLTQDLPLLMSRGEWRESERVILNASAQVGDGVIIDNSGGPVLVDADVIIGAGSFIQGPCYLGPGTRIKPLSQLLHGCFVGPQCRLGGEIEESQFQGYANKQHHGFLGHAVVGEWVNLGAGVTNSDLKNNYSDVRIHQRGEDLDTGRRFVGCCLGDHVKVAIQGRLNTGTVLEAFTNWFGAGFPDKGLPPFTWGGDDGVQGYDLERCLATAAVVMSRRDSKLDDALAEIYRAHHADSSGWRREHFGES
jgi:UDP-N-acetylglucosamine diphosphorylase/glucosamine-1-phosphate N-acetyltransferase